MRCRPPPREVPFPPPVPTEPPEPPPLAPPAPPAPAASVPPQPAETSAEQRAAEPAAEPPVVSGDLASAQILLALVNSERRKAGLGDLAFDVALTAAAQAHAEAMARAGVMGHQLA